MIVVNERALVKKENRLWMSRGGFVTRLNENIENALASSAQRLWIYTFQFRINIDRFIVL